MDRFPDPGAPGRRPVDVAGAPRCLIADASSDVVGHLVCAIRSAAPRSVLLTPVTDLEGVAERVERDRPDVLFLDLGMPRMTGITVLRAIRQFRPRRTVLLAPLSAEAGIGTWEALTLGAHGFLAKRGAGQRARLGSNAEGLAGEIRRFLSGITRPAIGRSSRRTSGFAEPGIDAGGRGLVLLLESGRLTRISRLLSLCGTAQGRPLLLVTPHHRAYSEAFREGLDRICPLRVRFAREGEPLLPGQLFFARGGAGHVLRIHSRGVTYDREPRPAPATEVPDSALLTILADGPHEYVEVAARPRRTLNWVRRASRSCVRPAFTLSNESAAVPLALSLYH